MSEATYSMTEAKARWLELVDRAEAGESFTITKWGKPVAKLKKYEPPAKPARKRRTRKL
jgi:prevent-host-death family protein